MDKWTKACLAQTNSQNVYKVGNKSYFWEISRREHLDGAITGTILEMLPDDKARPVGSFRINPDGDVARAPKFLKDAAKA
jgi:hypothetical protein